jgi:hypothetical protein
MASAGGDRPRPSHNNLYNRPENRARTADRATATRDVKQTRPAPGRDNNVYADPGGNVARRTGDQWETREQGAWKPEPSVSDRPAPEPRQPQAPARETRPAPTPTPSTPSVDGGTWIGRGNQARRGANGAAPRRVSGGDGGGDCVRECIGGLRNGRRRRRAQRLKRTARPGRTWCIYHRRQRGEARARLAWRASWRSGTLLGQRQTAPVREDNGELGAPGSRSHDQARSTPPLGRGDLTGSDQSAPWPPSHCGTAGPDDQRAVVRSPTARATTART